MPNSFLMAGWYVGQRCTQCVIGLCYNFWVTSHRKALGKTAAKTAGFEPAISRTKRMTIGIGRTKAVMVMWSHLVMYLNLRFQNLNVKGYKNKRFEL